MGLDATVFCDCFERGRLRTPPAPAWRVSVGADGARTNGSTTLADDMAFDAWNRAACPHDDGRLLHHRLGNIGQIAFVRAALSEHPDRFPLVLRRVVYSGCHAGDFIGVRDLPQLAGEAQALGSMRFESATANAVEDFRAKVAALVDAATRVRKPISF